MAQRIVIIFNRTPIEPSASCAASSPSAWVELRVVKIVVADTYLRVDDSLLERGRVRERSKRCSCGELILVEDYVLNEIWLVEIAELELYDRAIQFIRHRFENGIRSDCRSPGLRRGHHCGRQRQISRKPERLAPGFWFRIEPHCRTSRALPASGAGKMGMRSEDFAFFCTSICVVRIAGEMADTGTLPDSAPQNPLNTSTLSEAATILLNEVRGVPMRSAPRTSSSGRPST